MTDAGEQASTRKRDIMDFSGFAFPAASQVLHNDATLPITSCLRASSCLL